MRVTSPRNATPLITAGLAGAVVAAYFATAVGSFPTPVAPSSRGADAVESGEAPRRAGSIESMALDPRAGTGLGSTPMIDANGRLWVVHHAEASLFTDASGGVLVSVCPDVRCGSAERFTLAPGAASYGLDAELVSGGIVASYLAFAPSDDPQEGHHVTLVTCVDDCTETLQRVIAGPLSDVTGTAVAVDDVERPFVAYRGAEDDLELAGCLDTSCSSWTTTRLAPNVTDEVALILSAAGAPIVASRDAESRRLQVTLCHDPSCQSHRTVVLGGEGGGLDPALALTANDELLVSHTTASGLELIWCGSDCRTPIRRLVARGPQLGTFSTVALDGELPVLSFYDEVQRTPVLMRCEDPACRTSTSAVIDDRRLGGEQLGLVLTERGHPVLTYQDGAGKFLRLTRCASPACGTAQPLSTMNAIEVVGTSDGPVAVYVDADGNVRAVACGDASSCADAPTRVLDAGGTPPVEAVAALGAGLDGLALATRTAGATSATIRLCADDCAAVVAAQDVDGVARLLALHATPTGAELLHVDLAGSVAAVHCTADGCGNARLLGTPGAHATIAVTATGDTAVAWHDPGTGDVWAVRCDRGCDAAPRPIGNWPAVGDLDVAATASDLAVAVELVDIAATQVARCQDECVIVNTVPGRPLSLLADQATVTLLVADGDRTLVHVCNGRCTTADTHLDAGLMTPALLSTDPLRLLGRDAATMHVVTRYCDREACHTEGLGGSDGGRSQPGIK